MIATQTYNAQVRRIRRTVTNGGLPDESVLNGTTDFLYAGIQCVEERSDADTPLRQYVWGRYVDELIQQEELTGGDAGTYYLLSDLLYRATALTDDGSAAAAAIQEAYDCDAYGQTLIFSAPGTASNWWASNATQTRTPLSRFLFTGRRYDPETSDDDSQTYFYRARYYSPQRGRFLSRDPIGYGAGMGLYAYVLGLPAILVDPLGLQEWGDGYAVDMPIEDPVEGVPGWRQTDYEKIASLCNCDCLGLSGPTPRTTDDLARIIHEAA